MGMASASLRWVVWSPGGLVLQGGFPFAFLELSHNQNPGKGRVARDNPTGCGRLLNSTLSCRALIMTHDLIGGLEPSGLVVRGGFPVAFY